LSEILVYSCIATLITGIFVIVLAIVTAAPLCCGLYPAGPAAILHRPDPIMIVAEPSFVVELA
jgi:hypothetical protein